MRLWSFKCEFNLLLLFFIVRKKNHQKRNCLLLLFFMQTKKKSRRRRRMTNFLLDCCRGNWTQKVGQAFQLTYKYRERCQTDVKNIWQIIQKKRRRKDLLLFTGQASPVFSLLPWPGQLYVGVRPKSVEFVYLMIQSTPHSQNWIHLLQLSSIRWPWYHCRNPYNVPVLPKSHIEPKCRSSSRRNVSW